MQLWLGLAMMLVRVWQVDRDSLLLLYVRILDLMQLLVILFSLPLSVILPISCVTVFLR